MSKFIQVFEDIFRWLLWVIIKLLFLLIDTLYDSIKAIACFNIFTRNEVWDYFRVFMSAFLVLFIVIRLFKRYLKTIIDEEEAEHFKPDKLILKIGSIGLLVVLLPFVLKQFGTLLSLLISQIESIFNVTSTKFSDILLSSIPNSNIDINMIDKIGITEKVGNTYKYIPSLNNFLVLVIATVFAGYLMLLLGIQLGGRMLSMIMKLVIAPYSLSSIVDEKNDSFPTWWKLFIADFLSSYLQMILLIIGTTVIMGFNFTASNSFASGLAKDIALIGSLFGVLNAPNGISQLIGSDIGVSSALQSMQTMMMATQITGSAGRLIGGAATFAGASATYLAGRTLGGSSMKSIAQNTIPATQALTGTLSSLAGGYASGQTSAGGANGVVGVGSEGGASALDLSMKQTPAQQGSFVSDRSGMSGWSNIGKTIMSGGGIGDTLASIKNSGLPNVVGSISNYNQSNGSVKQMLNQGNYTGLAVRGASWGASKLYGASMNRLQRGFTNHRPQQQRFTSNPAMYNFNSLQNINSNPGVNTGGNQ